ncbi:MAG: hypothetical protein RIF32_04415 [Leptospirales bacterium]|jgi:hypothetical protein
MEMTHWIAPLFVLWTLALLLVLLRRSIPLVWRLSSLLVLIFYGAWYAPELMGPVVGEWIDQPVQRAALFLVALIQIFPLILIFAWPLMLFQASRERTAEAAGKHLRTLTIVTLFFWLFWLGAYARGADLRSRGLEVEIRKLLELPASVGRGIQELDLPALPQPPAGE